MTHEPMTPRMRSPLNYLCCASRERRWQRAQLMCPCLMRARLCTFLRACLLAWAATGRRTWCGHPCYLCDFGKWLSCQ